MRHFSNFNKVAEFHQVFGQPVKEEPTIPSKERVDLRLSLIEEELGELREAIEANDIVEIADALTDILYVTYGAGLEFGVPLDVCFHEVHSSNMSKLGEDGNPIYREDGKIMKGPNYFPPDLKRIILG
jgi:predicted HAD superfamily Cof-like phosphohydrolase